MRAPKISIGLMVYNEIHHIEKTLNNILSQSFQNFELLIGNNASTDGCTELIEKYAHKDERIVHIIRPQNLGALKNWNSLVSQASGEYFVLAAGHDFWTVDYLKSLSEELDKNPRAVLVFAKTQWKDLNGEDINKPTSLLDTSGMSNYAIFISLMYANQHYMYGMARVSSMLQTRLQKQIIGSGELYLQELAQLGDFVLVENQRWYRVQNRSEESITDTLRRYHRILFSSDYDRIKFTFFPNTQFFFNYLMLPFILKGINIRTRILLCASYPLLLIRFMKPIMRDFKWLVTSRL